MHMNLKSYAKEHRLFNLMYICNSNSFLREQANIILNILNAFVSFIIFLSLPQINIISRSTLSISLIMTLLMMAIQAIILLQLIICYVYQKQYFIALQWKAFRYILFPILTLQLFRQILQQSNLNIIIAVAFQVFNILTSFILTSTFTAEAYTYRKLLHRELPINSYFIILQILMYALSQVMNQHLRTFLTFLLLISSLGLNRYFFYIASQLYLEYRILSCISFAYCWYAMILTVQLFTGENQVSQLLMLAFPGLVYKFYLEMIRQKDLISYNAFVSIFQNPDTINFQQFIDSLQPIIQEILQYSQKDENKDFVESMIINYYYQHAYRCLNMECPFRFQDYKYELKNIKQRKVLKDVLMKICRKIDFLFRGMYTSYPENNALRISIIQFYIFCFPNKTRALEIIAQLQSSPLTFYQSYQLFRVKMIIQQMESLQVVGQIKLDQQLLEFQNLIQTTLSQMMEFWSFFLQEKVDFQKVLDISTKLFPCRKKINQYYEAAMNQQTFSSLKILKIYSIYCLMIQRNQLKTWRINDYIGKLLQKLAQKKQIQYLTFQSQIGLIALSLSEAKLGKITMANEQAASIFKYSKKQLKSIRVNDIMPHTFQQQHDNYLKVFLQNRFKKVNSDQRYLYGKNKQGFIFPILLQLQRTISSTADELLFIANIKKYKTLSSPIGCITDEQGFITDVTATFKDLFLRDDKKKTESRMKIIRTTTGMNKQIKNIQEVLPQFYIYDLQKESTQKFHLKQSIRTHQGLLQIDFTVSLIRFPLKKNGGFIIQGTINQPPLHISFPHLSMTKSIENLIERDMLSGVKVNYEAINNRYQISKRQTPMSVTSQKQFTIPFINMNDMANLFKNKEQIPKFGEDIKTLRLVKNHYQRVEQPSQFSSQDQIQNNQLQTKTQILKINQQVKVNNKPLFLILTNFGVLFLLIVIFAFSVFLISEYSNFSNAGSKILIEGKDRLQNKAFLAKYIFLYTAIKSGQFDPVYQEKIIQSRGQFIQTTIKSNIPQKTKEEMLKIAYLKEEANLTLLLTQQTINASYEHADVLKSILDPWVVVIILLSLMLVISIVTYILYYREILSIYEAFMILEEKCIKDIHNQCKEVIDVIQKNSEKAVKQKQNKQKENQPKNNQKKNQQQEEENQNPVKKRKRFKKQSLKHNLNLILRVSIPMAVAILLCTMIIVYMIGQNSNIFSQMNLHQQMYSVFPQSSVRLVKVFLKNTYNYNLEITDNFIFDYQKLQNIIYNFQQEYPNTISEDYFAVLLGNICKKPQSQQLYGSVCDTYENGILTTGLSKTINLFANSLQNYRNNPTNQNLEKRFTNLDYLQYDYIEHILSYLTDEMYTQILGLFKVFQNTLKSLTILMLIACILSYVYFAFYPILQMEQAIIQTKDLIILIPQEQTNLNQKKKGDFKAIQTF